MWEAVEILVISVELLIFYLRAICQRILRREFGHELLPRVVSANRLESPPRWNTATRFRAASVLLIIIHIIVRLVRS